MSTFDDSSSEMHDDTLSSEDVEALFDGSSDRPDLGELETLFAEVRALPNRTESPDVSAALAEFVGVDLTPTTEPILLDDADETLVLASSTAPSAKPVRRNSMIGHAVAFLGTIGGKVAVGTTVAAASLGGAHATGAIDVPYLPDTTPAQIETIDVPEDPDALAFVEDSEAEADAEATADLELDLDAEAEAEGTEAEVDLDMDAEAEVGIDSELIIDDFPPRGVKDVPPVEEPKDEEVKQEEPTKEEPKQEEPKKEEPKDDEPEKNDDEKAGQELIGALEEALHVAKDKVRADATALIKPLEAERDGLLEGLEATHAALAEEWEPVIASLRADLEATSDEGERAEIEADIDAAETAWADARVAAELEVDPRLDEIDDLFEVIETERDAEIDRLIAEFLAAVEEIEKG